MTSGKVDAGSGKNRVETLSGGADRPGLQAAEQAVVRDAARAVDGRAVDAEVQRAVVGPADGVDPAARVTPVDAPGPGQAPRFIGHVYHLEGTIDGRPVQYTGSTAQELRDRFSGHRWAELIRDPNTTITVYEVTADPRADRTQRGTDRSAMNQALRSVEELHRQRVAGQGPSELNGIRAATPDHVRTWQLNHRVTLGAGLQVDRLGNRLNSVLGPAGTMLDALSFSRDMRMAEQGLAMAPSVFRDQHGHFTISMDRGPLAGIFGGNRYYRTYVDGDREGEQVDMTRAEYNQWSEENRALYGYVDMWGDFQPGLLRPEPPMVYLDADRWA